MFDFIAVPMGKVLLFIYQHMSFNNYGIAMIIFTVLINAILLPLSIKQAVSTAKTGIVKPQIDELKKKYKNDKQKLQQEIMKCYKENGVNPLGGCLPMLIQIPIFFGLLYVVGKPLTYMLGYSSTKIMQLVSAVPSSHAIKGFYEQIGAVNYYNILDLNFLGVNLGKIPSYNPSNLFGPEGLQYWLLFLVPVLLVVTTYVQGKLTMKPIMSTNSDDKSNDISLQMQKNMNFMMPIMMLIISFQVPAALGLYWITGAVFRIFQQQYINIVVLNKKEAEVK